MKYCIKSKFNLPSAFILLLSVALFTQCKCGNPPQSVPSTSSRPRSGPRSTPSHSPEPRPVITEEMIRQAKDNSQDWLAGILNKLKDGEAIDINERNGTDQETLLHKAAHLGNPAIVEALLIEGADPCIKDANDRMPLDLITLRATAANESKNEVARLLIQKMPKSTLETRWRMLHTASTLGLKAVVEAFLDQGVDTNKMKDVNESTPLHLAALHGHVEVVKALLAKGAKANEADVAGKTPLDFAESSSPRGMDGIDRKNAVIEELKKALGS